MQRRTLFKLGLGGLVVVGLGGIGAALWRPGVVGGRLTLAGRSVMGPIAEAVLDGMLPEAPPERAAALRAHAERLDAAVAAFPLAVQQELSQLLALLATATGRLALAGLADDWHAAGVTPIQHALERMRRSRSELRQQTYHALRDLTNGAYFADPATWPALGYPGPIPLPAEAT